MRKMAFATMKGRRAKVSDSMYAEKLYTNRKLYTMEQEGQAVEAVGVRDGKIVFTGTNEEAEKIESDEIIDIKGRAVFPGFIDCHQHTLAYARTTKEVNLVGTKSVQDILDRQMRELLRNMQCKKVQ